MRFHRDLARREHVPREEDEPAQLARSAGIAENVAEVTACLGERGGRPAAAPRLAGFRPEGTVLPHRSRHVPRATAKLAAHLGANSRFPS